eukprot:1162092_1
MSPLLLLVTMYMLLPQVQSKTVMVQTNQISDRLIDLQDRTSSILWNHDTLTCDMKIIHHNSNLNHKSVFQYDIYHISFESLLSPVNTSYFDILSPRTTYMEYNDTITLRFKYHTQSTYGDVIHRIVFHMNLIVKNQHKISILNDNGFDVIISPAKDHSTPHVLSNDTQKWHNVSVCLYHYPLTCRARLQIVHLNTKDQVVVSDLSRLNSKPFDKEITM